MANTTDRRINLYINGREVRNNIKSIGAEYKRAKNELAKMTRGTEEYHKKAAQVKKLRGMLDQHNQQIRQTETRWQKTINTAKNLLPAFSFAAILGGVARLTQKWIRWKEQLEETRHEISQLTGLTGQALDNITAKTQATAKVFEKDVKEITKTANSLSKQMEISFDGALDIIQDGLASGADISGEFLRMLEEYPAQLNEIGLNARQSVAMMSQQVTSGVFSDKGIDAIKEANIRIREMTNATREAINNIGMSADEVQRQLMSGEKSVFEVIQEISGRMEELPPQSQKVGQAIADIFGGPGEDAGLRYLTTLHDINMNLDDIVENSDDYTKKQVELADAQERVSKSMNAMFGKGSGWMNVKVWFKDRLADTLSLMRQVKVLRNQIGSAIGLSNKGLSEFQDTILDTVPSLRKLANQVRQHGTETDKGREALTKLNSRLVEMYGSEGLKMAQNFTEQQTKLARKRTQSHEEEEESAEEKKKKIAQEERELAERILEIRQELSVARMSDMQKEIYQVDEKYSKLLEKAEGFEEKKKQLIELKEREIKNIRDKYLPGADSISKDLEKMRAFTQGVKDAAEDASGELLDLDMNGIQRVLDRTAKLQAKLEEKDIFGMTQEDWQELENNFAKVQAGAWQVGATLQNIAQIQANQNQKELNEYTRVQDEKQRSLERRLEAGLITEAQYNRQVESMEEDLNEKKAAIAREEARRQKQINTFQAIVDTAAAVVGFLANPSGLAGVALSAMAAVAGATQIAAIQSQPIPQFAEGGRVKSNQLIEVAEGNKEEGILSNKTLTSPETAPLANYLLDRQAGIASAVPDASAIQRAADYNNFRKSGLAHQSASTQTNVNNYYSSGDQEVKQLLSEMNKKIGNLKHIKAIISHDILEDHEEEMKLLDKMNRM